MCRCPFYRVPEHGNCYGKFTSHEACSRIPSLRKAAVLMDAFKWTHSRSGLYAAGAMELVGQLRNHMLQRLRLVGGLLCGTNYGVFVCCRDYELHYSVLSS